MAMFLRLDFMLPALDVHLNCLIDLSTYDSNIIYLFGIVLFENDTQNLNSLIYFNGKTSINSPQTSDLLSTSQSNLDVKSIQSDLESQTELQPNLLIPSEKSNSISTFQSLPNLDVNSIKSDLVESSQPKWVLESLAAISAGDIELSPFGVGGTYFVKKDGISISVFKPLDEEPGAPFSPKKTTNKPLLPWGGGGMREVAAYLLDKGFAGVPETHMIEYFQGSTPKKGSLQKFIPNDGDCVDIGSSKFNVQDVHRIGVLDLRILNMDRNDENMLINKKEKEIRLIPIDHSYSFPDQLSTFFEWQFWKQSKEPFSQDTLAYIESIDLISDSRLLLELGLSFESVRLSIASTILLKKCAKRGSTLFTIASLVSGNNSQLAKLLTLCKTEKQFDSGFSRMITFIDVFSTVVDNFFL